MPVRYHLLPFPSCSDDAAQRLLGDIGGLIGNVYWGNCVQWTEIVRHLGERGARTLVVQEQVRDPDFTAEYEAFYAKQQREMSRFCVRVHAFREPAVDPSDDPKEILKFIDAASRADSSYLGFVTLRPLRHAPVGASIIVDSPARRALCRDKFPVHIAGTSFEVEGTPFLQQDNAVGACAQASIWMALRTLRRRSGNSAYSPAELTVSATRYMATDRVFPGRRGLRVEQMLSAIQASDHDPLVIPLSPKAGVPPNPYDVMETVQPYIESGLPVIALLSHDGVGHAVVAVGLAPGAAMRNLPAGLIVHNDNSGPYQVLPYSDPKGGYALNHCVTVIVPLPQGILMSASEAREQSESFFDRMLTGFVSDPARVTAAEDLWTRTYLCTRHAFRKWAKADSGLDPAAVEVYRASEMPRYVWVTELHEGRAFEPLNPACRTRLGEVVLDAAADALHGDALVFMRLAKQMAAGELTKFPGLLHLGDNAGIVALGTAELTIGIAEPWDQT